MTTKRQSTKATATYCVERYEKTGAKRVVKRGMRRAEANALVATLAKKFTASAFVASREEAPAAPPKRKARR